MRRLEGIDEGGSIVIPGVSCSVWYFESTRVFAAEGRLARKIVLKVLVESEEPAPGTRRVSLGRRSSRVNLG